MCVRVGGWVSALLCTYVHTTVHSIIHTRLVLCGTAHTLPSLSPPRPPPPPPLHPLCGVVQTTFPPEKAHSVSFRHCPVPQSSGGHASWSAHQEVPKKEDTDQPSSESASNEGSGHSTEHSSHHDMTKQETLCIPLSTQYYIQHAHLSSDDLDNTV